jgi:hypothetical protein
VGLSRESLHMPIKNQLDLCYGYGNFFHDFDVCEKKIIGITYG